MLIGYIPSTHTVVEADLLQPWISPQFGGKNGPHPLLVYLDQELKRLGLDTDPAARRPKDQQIVIYNNKASREVGS